MHFDRFCITLTKVRLTNMLQSNRVIVILQRRRNITCVNFVRLYVVVLIKSTERHFKESNTCLRHIFTQLPGSEEIHSLTKNSICHLDTGSQNLSSNKINR